MDFMKSLALAVLILADSCLGGLVVAPINPDGIFARGGTVTWKISLDEIPPQGIPAASYTLEKDGGKVLKQGKLDLSATGAEVSIPATEPGTLFLKVTVGEGDSKLEAKAGAMVDPEDIPRSSPRPADFDEFWSNQLDELAKTPANVVLTDGNRDKPEILHSYLTMDLPYDHKLQAQIARPEREEKYPAMIIFQYAGIYPLPPEIVTRRAAEGWLVLNVNAHDLPLNEAPEFYTAQNNGPLKEYAAIGRDDRTKSYFLRMLLACSRAVDYMAGRPDWDGRTLVVTGTSQGGLQAIAAAALNPKVTAVVVNVPAGCDHTAPLAGRGMPWPAWLKEGSNQETLTRTAPYFDPVNFASRVKCPSMVALGLLDRTATASGIQVMINELAGPVEKVIMPASEHQDKNGSQSAFRDREKAWFNSLKAGLPPMAADAP